MKKKAIFCVLATSIILPSQVLSSQNDKTTLSPITIENNLSETTGEYSYYKTKSYSATKTDTPLKEVPQSVQIVNKEIIQDTNSVTLSDTLVYVSGTSYQNNFGGMWDNFSIRGFSGHENTGMSLLKNGFSDNRGYNAPRDTANIESVEFLKGPSGSLYGNSEPGGTINIVTKQPKFDPEYSIESSLGSENFYRVSSDLTGPINESLAFRLNVAKEKKDSFRDYIKSDRTVIAPSLLWSISDNSFLTYFGEYIEQKAPLDRGIIAINGNKNAISNKTFFGNPNDGDMKLENYTHQLKLEHYFSDSWSGNAGIAYKNNSLKGTASEVRPFLNVTTDSVLLRTRYRDYNSNDLAFQGDIKNVSTFADIKNTLLLGTELYKFEADTKMNNLNNSVRISNIYSNPTYTTLLTGRGNLITDRNEEQKSLALFAQDEIEIGNFRFLTGVRYDKIEMDTINNLNKKTLTQNDYAVSPRVGVTYILNPEWALYATSGKSFRPNSGVDINGNTFEAEEGISLETGIKFESLDKKIGATLAVYQINKNNVLTGTDPNGTYSVAAGEVESKGVEFDINGKITDNIKINLNYAYTNAEVTKDEGGVIDYLTGSIVNLKGKSLSNVPMHSGGLLAMWEDNISIDSSYGLGAGISYVGKREGNYINSFDLSSYTTTKLISYWKMDKNITFKLNIDNLFDKEYIISSYDRSWLTPGDPRSFKLTMNYKF
ncbi:TonB-dependent siderophore receptor [Arcobacter cloacae]|uniref:TonB-dependent siderophore receptor n=1 Tax=Arcobacter cloacae TaxID=1054034 RepID=A0A6M8NRG3_9BACT|nr:TonB-dependent siderophore receptor [Arcobacter cloacae]QKF91187.1 TonB-dependent siderophore receptor [Arcobacter cloacae]RXI40438.1 TonB-dependent siderophore receptor [Arcobacter cloacae]